MSYEFNPDSPTFEFPNPYKVENLALIVVGCLVMAAGVASMFSARTSLAHGGAGRALMVVGIGVGLLAIGIFLLARAFTQLRYFFGRNRPDSLAPLVNGDQDGDTPTANFYKETLRQNAITFREPHGPLNGLLYSWLPQLIFAPRVIQESAQSQFNNFLALAATFISFLVCLLMFGAGPAKDWIGLLYGAFALLQIMRPMVAHTRVTTGAINEAAHVGIGSLVVLIAFAVLGPVLLGMLAPKLPELGGVAINGVVGVALLCTLLGCGLFGLALNMQLQPAPQAVGAARITETLTMNAHPNKLVEELDRFLMSRWYQRIPNRRYSRRSPRVDAPQGMFNAELFEETQPRPVPNRIATGLGHALALRHFFWLTCLTGLASVYLLIGCGAALLGGHAILDGDPAATLLVLALSQFAIGGFCYRAAHVLWGRFDFVSELIWVDLSGSYESANVHIGNRISGTVETMKSVINVESMTMRVWVSEIDTVIFGKDAQRQLVGMRGLPALAAELGALLKDFGESRSMVVAPTGNEDVERARKIGQLQQIIATPSQGGAEPRPVPPATPLPPRPEQGGTLPPLQPEQGGTSRPLPPEQGGALPPLPPEQGGPLPPPAPGGPSAPQQQRRFCTACGTPADAQSRFCGQCGTALPA